MADSFYFFEFCFEAVIGKRVKQGDYVDYD